MTLVLGMAIGACSYTSRSEPTVPSRPEAVPVDMICREWIALPLADRSEYAAFRLVELRTDDGVRFNQDRPTSHQVDRMRVGMEAECEQESLDVAAVVRVSHDVYVAAAVDRGLIS